MDRKFGFNWRSSLCAFFLLSEIFIKMDIFSLSATVIVICIQFTDLEEEFEDFRQKTEVEQAEKEEAIQLLREQLKAVEQRNEYTGTVEFNIQFISTLKCYYLDIF